MASVDDQTVKSALFWLSFMLILSSVFGFLERLCLSYFAEHVTRAYRTEYVKTLLQHDVEYIDSVSPGKLGQRFSEQSSRIVDGLGPGLGILVETLGGLVCGMVIGFVYVCSLSIRYVLELAAHDILDRQCSHHYVLWIRFRNENGSLERTDHEGAPRGRLALRRSVPKH